MSLPLNSRASNLLRLVLSFLVLTLGTITVFAQNPPTVAPLNPAFIAYWNSVTPQTELHGAEAPDERALGEIPSPVDWSHLAQQPPSFTQQVLPSSYDLRTVNKVTDVRDQGTCGSCWTFASFGSMESALSPGETRDFSENNLKNLSGFDYAPCGGGQAYMSTAYLARWAGPVNETDDPYFYNQSSPDATTSNSPAGLPPQKHVQNVNVYPQRTGPLDNSTLKNALMTDGALHTSMRWVRDFYNKPNAAYYYNGAVASNHAVTLVGWDDNYLASNFNSPNPPGNGAFLIKNSWGTDWGNQGYFWISYYDTAYAIARESFAFVGNEAVTNYVRKYEYDPLGLVTNWGGNGTTAWFANAFSAVAGEPLAAVSFYAASNNSPYTIKVYTNVSGTANPTSGTSALTTTGTLTLAGYHTVVLPSQITLTSGQKFAVVVQLTTPGYTYPIPISSASKNYSSKATSSPGRSFTSDDGISWQDTTSSDATASVCLKAFTAAPSGDYTLIVNSTNPSSGVAITVTPLDVNNNGNGTTNFTRTYSPNATVTLTAPAANFSSWTGCDSPSNNVCTMSMNAAKAVTANYTGDVLTVNSSNPASGVVVTASPADLRGDSGGSTSFTRMYAPNTQVTLTAPAANFSSWSDCDSPNNVCTMTMNGAKSVTVNYQTASDYTLTVNSADPSSGISIAVTPTDIRGNGNGSTSFTRTYTANTLVTLTAPTTIATGNFSFWSGCDSAPGITCTVTMTSAKSVTANYLIVQYTGMPRALTLPMSSVNRTGVTLRGMVNPNGIATSYWFEYGTKPKPSKSTPVPLQALAPSAAETAVNASVTGLTPNTLYYFRLVAQNTAGTSRGRTLRFRSGGPQRPASSPPDATNAAVVTVPAVAPAETAIHSIPSTSSTSPLLAAARNTGAASGTATGVQNATLEVTPGRNVPLVLRLGGLSAGTVASTTCADLPKGATCSYDDDDQTMTITPAADTPAGSYPIRVIFSAER